MGNSNSMTLAAVYASPVMRLIATFTAAIGAFMALAGIFGLFPPEESVGVAIEMIAIGTLCFVAIAGTVFGSVQVTEAGVKLRDRFLYLRRQFIPREEIVGVDVALVRAWGGPRYRVFLVLKDEKRYPILILTDYNTKRGRAWVERARESIASTLSLQ